MDIPALKASVFQLFSRRNSEIEARFDADLQSWLDDLSRQIPWNSLWVPPLQLEEITNTWPISLTTPPAFKSGRWIAPGWLVTQPGISRYEFACPHEYEEWADPDWWGPTLVSQAGFCALFDEKGTFNHELYLEGHEMQLRRTSSAVNTRGCPLEYFIRTNDVGESHIHFRPIPDEPYLIGVGFQRTKPDIYIPPGEVLSYHNLLTNHQTIVQLYCLIKVASYFDEPNMKAEFEKELYGAPTKGIALAILEKTGLMGYVYAEQLRLNKQTHQTLQFYRSERQALGRKRTSRSGGMRYPGRYGYR